MKQTLRLTVFLGCLLPACAKNDPDAQPRNAMNGQVCDGRTDVTLGSIDGPACERVYQIVAASDQRANFDTCTEYTFESTAANDPAPCSHKELLGYCVDVDPRDASHITLVYRYSDAETNLDSCDELELKALTCLNRATNTWCNAAKNDIQVEVVSSVDEGSSSGTPVDTSIDRETTREPNRPLDASVTNDTSTSSPTGTHERLVDAAASDAATSDAASFDAAVDAALPRDADSRSEDSTDAGVDHCVAYDEYQAEFRSLVLEGADLHRQCEVDGECTLYFSEAYHCSNDSAFPLGAAAFPYAINVQSEAAFQQHHDDLASTFCPDETLNWSECVPEASAVVGYKATCETGTCASTFVGLGF